MQRVVKSLEAIIKGEKNIYIEDKTNLSKEIYPQPKLTSIYKYSDDSDLNINKIIEFIEENNLELNDNECNSNKLDQAEKLSLSLGLNVCC